MRIKNINVRTETPEMDVVHTIHPDHGGHIGDDRIKIHRLWRELEKNRDRFTE